MPDRANVKGSSPQARYVTMNTSQIAWFTRLTFQASRRFRPVSQTANSVAAEVIQVIMARVTHSGVDGEHECPPVVGQAHFQEAVGPDEWLA